MRSVADLLVSRSCNETHWHCPVEGTFPPAASLSLWLQGPLLGGSPVRKLWLAAELAGPGHVLADNAPVLR